MRFALPFACLLIATSTAAARPDEPNGVSGSRLQAELPRSGAPMATAPDMNLRGPLGPNDCRDRIHTVREKRGLPAVDRQTADPDEPLLIKALDQRIGGCSVMVMHHDINDIRQLPRAHEPRLMRAK